MNVLRADDVPGALPPLLDALVADWPYGPPRSAETRRRGIEQTMMRPEVETWAALENGRLDGLALLQPLPWDSGILGMETGRVELIVGASPSRRGCTIGALLDEALDGAARRAIRHVTVRVDAADDEAVHALETRGFLNVDALITLAASAAALPPLRPVAGLAVRQAAREECAAIGDIAAAAFRHGRFHADPSIPLERARAVYRYWTINCCEGTAAEAVLLAVVDGAPAGFIACRTSSDVTPAGPVRTGTIVLIAVADAARGRGVGTALIAAAGGWFRERDATTVEVGTQLKNLPASRLYERCGFRQIAASLTFRAIVQP